MKTRFSTTCSGCLYCHATCLHWRNQLWGRGTEACSPCPRNLRMAWYFCLHTTPVGNARLLANTTHFPVTATADSQSLKLA